MVYVRPELLTGWGRTAPSTAQVATLAPGEDPTVALADVDARGVIARGLGRAYGDPAQNGGGRVVRMPASPIALNTRSGTVTASAGVSLDELLRVIVPQGYFVPVTPGTRHVTVGGAIAADIHGKNHHVDGSFGSAVTSLDLLMADRQIRTLRPDSPQTREMFWATVGGMGLTGIIVAATFRLIPIETSRMRVDTWRTRNLDDLMTRMVAADESATYSVAWIDSVARGSRFGRGVLTTGEHATLADLRSAGARRDPRGYTPGVFATAPPVVPTWTLNRLSIRAFNEAWYRKAPAHREGDIASITGFFHPLDGVVNWNRMYGRGGFLQYQFAVPDSGTDVIPAVLARLQRVGAPSFLSVLKRFGEGNPAPLSFPMPGWTLTLDIATHWGGLAQALDELDEQVLAAGGRFYLAKDSRASGAALRAGYPRWADFWSIKARMDPQHVFQSDLSRRIFG